MQNLLAATVVLCLVLSLGHAASLVKPNLQPEHCSWGAQYWCSSPETANLCGKTEWCSLNDWPYDTVQDSSCIVAQNIIKNTRSLIRTAAQKPVSEYDFAMFIAKSCTLFKDDNERHQCKELVTSKDVLPKLVKLVDSKLSVKSVATAVGVCQKNIPKDTEDQPCQKCSEMVSSAKKIISKYLTQDAYMNLLEPQCVKLGQGHHLCQAMGQANYKDFFNGLINAPTASVCKGVTQCLGVSSGLQSVQGSAECETCKAVVSEIRQLDRSQSVQTVLRNLIKSSCGQLGNFAQMCDILADELLEHLSELIATEMEPEVICEELKLCGQSEQKGVQVSSPVGTAITCEICEFILSEIDLAIGSNFTEEELKKLVISDFCLRFPAPINDQCTALVKQYSHQIIQLFVNEVNSKLICTTLGLCKNATNILQSVPKLEQQSNNSCSLCKYVVTFLETFIEKNATESEIMALLDRVCELLPQNYSQECEALVQQYGPLIVQMLVAEMQPEKVCEALKLCPQRKLASLQVKIRPKQPNSELCDACKYVVTYLDTFLNENSTEAEIEAVLEEVCNIIPENWRKQCDGLVQAYAPLIIQLLIGELQPEEVCKLINFCPANKQGTTLRQTAGKPLSGVSCVLCEFVMQKLDAFLADKTTETEVQEAFEKVCELLPVTMKSECDQLLREYGPLITELLVHELDPKKICTYLGLCKGALPHVAVPELKRASPLVKVGKQKTELCALCESVTQTLENILKQNATQAEIISALDRVCDLLPDNDKGPCVQLLPMYTGYVIDLIEQELPVKLVCKVIKICVDDEVKEPKSQKLSSSLKKGELCPLCLLVFEEVYAILEQNYTETAIEAALDKVCDALPSSIKSQCTSFVGLYLPYVVDLIVQEMPPNQICQELGLCNATVGHAVKLAQSLQVKKESSVKAGELCTLCIYVFEVLDKLLPLDSTQTQIEAALDQVCTYLPSFKDQCEKFVALYTPFVIDMITKKFTPTQICNELGLCVNSTSLKLEAPVNVRKDPTGPECALCEYVMKYLTTLLSKNATVQEIEAALSEVCSVLPSAVKSECVTFIDTYTPLIVILLQTVSPDQVCSSLGLCSSQVKEVKLEAPVNVRKDPTGPECALCEYVMKYLTTLLSKNATVQEIEAALSEVCSVLPSAVKSECVTFIDTYTPLIVILLQTVSPDQVCSSLGLCSSQVKEVKLEAPVNVRKVPTGPECALCEYVMKYLTTLLSKNATVQEIEAALSEVCSVLPSAVKSECVTFIDTYTPLIVILLQTVSPDQVCSSLGLCSSQVKEVKLEAPINVRKVPTGPECALCEYVMKYLTSLLSKNATVQEIEAALSEVCSVLPSAVKSECVTFIDTYTPLIVILLQTVSPDQVCSSLGLCSSQVKEDKQHTHVVIVTNSTKYDENSEDRHASGRVAGGVLAPPKSLLFVSESTTSTASTTTPAYRQYCSTCKFAMYDFQNAMAVPLWQKQFKTTLAVLCTYLQSGQALCQQLVNENYQYLLSTIGGFNFPMEFCQKINFCEPPDHVETETRCSSCKTVVKVLKSQSHQMATSEEMNALAESTCKMASSNAASQLHMFVSIHQAVGNIPADHSLKPLSAALLTVSKSQLVKLERTQNEAMKCKAIMKQYMPQIVQLTAKYDDPASVCQAASLCAKPAEMLYKVLRP